MKVLILAGGYGTRISEESIFKPKPMIEIGSKPILWHIMKSYSHFGFNEFIVLCGYKGHVIKEYFANYHLYQNDFTIDLKTQSIETHHKATEDWKVTLLNTGLDTCSGGRIKKASKYLNNEPFLLTYGDGLCDVNIQQLLNFHKEHGKLMTVTAAQPEGRFGSLNFNEQGEVEKFLEKPKGDGGWINAGFFVCDTKVLDYIDGDSTMLEREPMQKLAIDGQLMSYKHHGFWKPMDSIRDKNQLTELWKKDNPPWKVW